jgi:DNA-binding YbaB/EbfC family protein
MFGGLGDLANLIKNAKHIQARAKEMHDKLELMSFSGESGAGAVTATVNGKMALLSIKLSPDVVNSGDVEMLEDLIRAAVSAAQRKAADGLKAQVQEMTGGMNLPPGLEGILKGT